MTRTSRTQLVLAALLVAPLLAVAQPAAAAKGDLTQVGRPPAACITETGTIEACTDGRALQNTYRTAISKDGRTVYVASQLSDALTVLSRNTTTGALTQLTGTAGCISETGSDGCADGRGLDGASAVAISDNGATVYAASANNSAVAVFARNTTSGALTQLPGTAGCISETGADGCADGRGLDRPGAISVTADGRSVYVGSNDSDGVAVFSRNVTSGVLTQLAGAAGCITETGADGCTDGDGLVGVLGVAHSPDGKSVYVTAEGSKTVSVFARKTTTAGAPLGSLTRLAGTAGCVSATGAGGCVDGRGIDFVNAVAVSSDSRSVYVSSNEGLSVFSRQTTTSGGTQGALTQLAGTAGCVAAGGSDGCADATGFGVAQGIAVSPDGKSVYAVTTADSGAVVAFARSATGALTQLAGTAACTSETGAGGCADGVALTAVVGVSVSADSKSVYVNTYSADGGVAVMARQTTTTGGTQGKLTQVGVPPGACVSEDGSADVCVDGTAMQDVTSTAASPDGKSVYVTSSGSDAVAVFNRNMTTGVLTQLAGSDGCVSETGAGGCVDGAGLNGARSVTVSADSKTVYVVSNVSNAIAVFARNTATGALTQLGTGACISETGAGVCADGVALDGPRSVSVSADGKSVYVVSEVSNAVAVFARQTTTTGGTLGRLTQLTGTAACVSETGSDGCTDGLALEAPASITVSGDNKSVYVASQTSDAVASFTRQTTTAAGNQGKLTQMEGSAACVSETGAGGCADGDGLDGASSITVSPDGASVYVAAVDSDAVAAFSRQEATTGGTQGKLTQLDGTAACISETGAAECADGRGLDGATSVAVNHDGTSVYVASSVSDAVAVFSRQTTTTAGNQGKLTQASGSAGCLSETGADGCFDAVALDGALSVVSIKKPSVGGTQSVYVASAANAVAAFTRQP